MHIKWALGRYIGSTCITHDSHSSKVQFSTHASISVPILGHIFNVLFAKLQLNLFSAKLSISTTSLLRLEHL